MGLKHAFWEFGMVHTGEIVMGPIRLQAEGLAPLGLAKVTLASPLYMFARV